MRKIISAISFSIICSTSYGQILVSIDSIYSFIKQNSIYSNNADWQFINKEFKTRLQIAKTDIDSIKSIIYVFEQLNDYHSSITYNGRQFSNYPAFDDSSLKYLIPLVNLSNQQMGIFKTKIIEGRYLYLQVPGVKAWGENVAVYAKMLSDSLCINYSSAIKGIVIDLRLNDGGQFSSMATGLALLLGENYIGSGVDVNNTVKFRFNIRNHNLYVNDNPITSIKHNCNYTLSKIPVALLIGPNTRSSGSILAISFKGRKKTFFIGEPTANGYSTGNDYFTYSNNLTLNLSTSFSKDRNGGLYKIFVNPDVIIKGVDNFDNPALDKKVRIALKWLAKNSRH
jgi:carboxyl-terminal processing protease